MIEFVHLIKIDKLLFIQLSFWRNIRNMFLNKSIWSKIHLSQFLTFETKLNALNLQMNQMFLLAFQLIEN